MAQTPRYYIVEAEALPEVFLKVAEAKRMMETGEASTVNAAARKVGISRSAFYKYRDVIRPFQDMLQGRIVTVQIMLRDEPGVLSAVLNLFAEMGGNILTINQAIPGGGSAAVTIGVETSGLNGTMEEMLEAIGNVNGVIRCHILAG
jgi:chorismate mutase